MSDGIIITYEALFDLLRREKSRDELQELDSGFYSSVKDYLNEKQVLLMNSSDDFMDESEKIRIQIANIKKIIKELYERRERKIVNLSLFKARLNNKILDTRALLPEEKVLFEEIAGILGEKREGLLKSVLETKQASQKNGVNHPDGLGLSDKALQTQSIENFAGEDAKIPENLAGDKKTENKVIRFTNPVPKFLGTELEVYGPYEEEDIASLPSQIADILIRKGRAEELAK